MAFQRNRLNKISRGGPSAFTSSLYDKPWRDEPWGDEKEDSDYVKSYTPQSKTQHLRILLFGPPGSGKSSFINSVDSAVRGQISTRALTATSQEGCFTKEYRSYKIQGEQPGTSYPFVFSDTMGIERGSGRGMDVRNFKLIMEGHVNEGFKLYPGSVPTGSYYNPAPTINDKVHVLVCVVDTANVYQMDDDVVRKMKDVREDARDLRIPQIAILTKIDEACPKIKKNIRNVYKSKTLKEQMEYLSANLGFPMNCIFPVKNYSMETKTEKNTDTLILNTMRKIIDFGEDFLNDIAPAKATKQPVSHLQELKAKLAKRQMF